MFCKVYILYGDVGSRYYIGSSENEVKRLEQHNSGRVTSTKGYRPWRVVYLEEFPSRSDAYKREMQIKSFKGGEAFKKLVLTKD